MFHNIVIRDTYSQQFPQHHHIVQVRFPPSFYYYHHHHSTPSRVLGSNPLHRLRLAVLRTTRIISALAHSISLATDAPLDRLGLVSDLLADLVEDGLGVLVGGAQALDAGALGLAMANLHAVQLVAGLALHGLAVRGLVVDGLARGAGEGVKQPCLRGRVDVCIHALAGSGVDGVRMVRVLVWSGAGGKSPCAELGQGFVAYLLA